MIDGGITLIKILIVEDESIVAMAIREMVERLGYQTVDTVLTGDDAIRRALELYPDIILMDIRLKGDMDGIDAAKKIRQMADIPIIYLTAYGDEETVNRSKETTPSAYIIKPFNELSLRSSIEITLYQHELKRKLLETTQHLENVINNISEMLLCFDDKNRLILVNTAAEVITGYTKRELQRVSVEDLPFLKNPSDLISIFQKSKKNMIPPSKVCLHIQTKTGMEKSVAISSISMIENTSNGSNEMVVLGSEISMDTEAFSNLTSGQSYLLKKKESSACISELSSFSRIFDAILFISRDPYKDIPDHRSLSNVNIVPIGESLFKDGKYISDLDDLQANVTDFCRCSEGGLVLLDRLDYFLLRSSFEEVMIALFKMADIISHYRCILILHVVPNVFDTRQMAIIENEFTDLSIHQLEKIFIDSDSYKILKTLAIEKQRKHIVSYKTLKAERGLSYPTIHRRVQDLEHLGLVYVFKQGRSKIIEITGKGESLLAQS